MKNREVGGNSEFNNCSKPKTVEKMIGSNYPVEMVSLENRLPGESRHRGAIRVTAKDPVLERTAELPVCPLSPDLRLLTVSST